MEEDEWCGGDVIFFHVDMPFPFSLNFSLIYFNPFDRREGVPAHRDVLRGYAPKDMLFLRDITMVILALLKRIRWEQKVCFTS